MSNQEPIANYKFNYKTTANKVMKNINLQEKQSSSLVGILVLV